MYSKRMSFQKSSMAALLLVTGLVAVSGGVILAHPDHGKTTNLIETALDKGQLATFVDLVAASGFEDTLRYRGPLTILAPSDDAFNALAESEFEELLENEEALQQMLRRHVIQGSVKLDAMLEKGSIKTVSGDSFAVVSDDSVRIGGARVKPGNIECTNGILHVIDRVLTSQEGEE